MSKPNQVYRTTALHDRFKEFVNRAVLLPLGDYLLGHPMMRRLRFLEEAQWWPRSRIEEERDRQLRVLIAISVQEVPFYKNLFEAANLKVADIRGVADLHRIPVVTKGMLREAYPQRTCRSTGQRTYETSTSGSTGTNFLVQEDACTAGTYRANFILALEWAGWRIGEEHLQTGITTKRNLERRIKDLFLGCHYFPAYKLDDNELDRWLDVLDRGRVRHLWGYPSSLFYLANRARQVGFNRELASIVTWGDQVFPHYREAIETAFHTRIFDTYGCSEGIQIAAQCGTGTHYHEHSLDTVVEYLDDGGERVPEGVAGNIVLTRLHPGPMPFIRYRLGDVGLSGSSYICSCGRGLHTMKSILGRTTDVVTTPSGNRLIVHFFTGVLEHFPEVETYQVIQQNPEAILLRIVPSSGFTTRTEEAIRLALTARGADLRIDIQQVSEIPLTPGGKRRFVIKL